MIPLGIDPATFWFVAQSLNHCATATANYDICHFVTSVYSEHHTGAQKLNHHFICLRLVEF
jgi:hypothetical protein